MGAHDWGVHLIGVECSLQTAIEGLVCRKEEIWRAYYTINKTEKNTCGIN